MANHKHLKAGLALVALAGLGLTPAWAQEGGGGASGTSPEAVELRNSELRAGQTADQIRSEMDEPAQTPARSDTTGDDLQGVTRSTDREPGAMDSTGAGADEGVGRADATRNTTGEAGVAGEASGDTEPGVAAPADQGQTGAISGPASANEGGAISGPASANEGGAISGPAAPQDGAQAGPAAPADGGIANDGMNDTDTTAFPTPPGGQDDGGLNQGTTGVGGGANEDAGQLRPTERVPLDGDRGDMGDTGTTGGVNDAATGRGAGTADDAGVTGGVDQANQGDTGMQGREQTGVGENNQPTRPGPRVPLSNESSGNAGEGDASDGASGRSSGGDSNGGGSSGGGDGGSSGGGSSGGSSGGGGGGGGGGGS